MARSLPRSLRSLGIPRDGIGSKVPRTPDGYRGNTQRTRNEAAKDVDLSTNQTSSSDDEYDWSQKNLPKRRPPVTAARTRYITERNGRNLKHLSQECYTIFIFFIFFISNNIKTCPNVYPPGRPPSRTFVRPVRQFWPIWNIPEFDEFVAVSQRIL